MTRVDTQQVHVGCNGGDTVAEFNRTEAGLLNLHRFIKVSKDGDTKQSQPHAYWMGFDGKSMVIPNSNTSASTLFDFHEYQTVDKTFTGTLPIASGMMPDSSKWYVSNYLGDTISVMCGPYPKSNCTPGTRIKQLNLLDDNADNRGYISNGRYLDATTPAGQLPGPAGGFSVQTPVSPDGKFVVIGNTFSGTITIIRTSDDTLVRSIPCDPGCHGVSFGAKKGGGYYAYVTSTFANRLIVLDVDPDRNGQADDAVIVGSVLLANDNPAYKDDTIKGNKGMGGQGVQSVPNIYNGWAQELPGSYKIQLTKEQRNPIGPLPVAADPAEVMAATTLIDSAELTNQATVLAATLEPTLAPTAVNDTYTMKRNGVLSEVVSLVKDIVPGGVSSNPTNLVNVNGTVYFTVSNGVNGVELWKSNGTAAGTVLVKDIVAGSGSSNPAHLTNVNGTLFFTAETAAHGRELWKSNGTAAGTVLVKDIWPGTRYGFYFGLTDTLINVNGTLFFTANNGVNGVELWKSNGTAAGTVLVKDINPGALTSGPHLLTVINGTLFFVANDGGVTGHELWKSNGTLAGTQLVRNINPSRGYHITELEAVNGTLFFTADNGVNGVELWKSDGTAGGTVLVKDIGANFSSNIRNLTNVNGTLYFTAFTLATGTELWKSNGTAAGTVLVKDITPGAVGTTLTDLTRVGSQLFFRANIPNGSGYELWKSDGTAAGTVSMRVGLLGLANGGPFITDVNGVAYFKAGNDLWKSDGTVAGTRLVLAGAQPRELVNVNGTLFFSGYQVGTGQELMKVSKVNVLANDRDPESNPLTALLVSRPANGTLTLNANGTFTYRPNTGFTGTDRFTYRASDGTATSNVATVTITVTA